MKENICTNCGNELLNDAETCPNCGRVIEAPPSVTEEGIPLSLPSETAAPPQKPSKKKAFLAAGAAVVLIAILAIAIPRIVAAIRNNNTYKAAMKLQEETLYLEAIEKIKSIPDYEEYKDSADKIIEFTYLNGKKLYGEGQFDDAIATFNDISDYEDSKDLIVEVTYEKASSIFMGGNYDEAIGILNTIPDYPKTNDLIREIQYTKATTAYAESRLKESYDLFVSLSDYKDSAEQVEAIRSHVNELYTSTFNSVVAKGMLIATISMTRGDSISEVWLDSISRGRDFSEDVGTKVNAIMEGDMNYGVPTYVSDIQDRMTVLKELNDVYGLNLESTSVEAASFATSALKFLAFVYEPEGSYYSFKEDCEDRFDTMCDAYSDFTKVSPGLAELYEAESDAFAEKLE